MTLIINWLVSALIIFIAAYILRAGIHVESFTTALAVAVVLGLFNIFIKPILFFLTLPITIVTFGLFMFVINACLILLAAKLVPGFEIESFWWAIAYSILIALISAFVQRFDGKR